MTATRSGKLFAMDSSSGNPVWIRNLGLTTENGAELEVKGLWNVRGVEHPEGPILAVAAVRTRDLVSFHTRS